MIKFPIQIRENIRILALNHFLFISILRVMRCSHNDRSSHKFQNLGSFKILDWIFSWYFFNISPRGEPFGIPQYVQCILHGLTSVLLCVPFTLADNGKSWFGGCTWWLPLRIRNCPYFSYRLPWLQRCFSNGSWFVLLCNQLNIANRERQWILQFWW